MHRPRIANVPPRPIRLRRPIPPGQLWLALPVKNREQILNAIPHRPPMLLLDEIAEWQHKRIVCKKTFQPDEWFFQGHYPDFPLVPGVLLCEAAMQAGAVLLSKHSKGEGVPVERIHFVGNIMIDCLVENLGHARESRMLAEYRLEPRRFVYVTLHRPSNVDEKGALSAIMRELGRIAEKMPVVFPIHPRTRKMLSQFGITSHNQKGLLLIEPVGYHDSLCLTENARLVLTDSGGLQEEATFFRTPCLTLRPNTERPITVTVGSNRLTNIERLTADVADLLNGPERRGQTPALWDGHTAQRTLECLLAASSGAE